MTQNERSAIIKRLQDQIRYMNRREIDDLSWAKEAEALRGMTMILGAMDIYASYTTGYGERSYIKQAKILFPGDTRPLRIYEFERDKR